MKSRKAKICEKTWLLYNIKNNYMSFDSVREVLVTLLMSGDELLEEKNYCSKLWEEFHEARSSIDKLSRLQSIRSRALYALRSVRADDDIAKLAGLKDEFSRDIYLPHRRGLVRWSFLRLNRKVKAEIAALINKRREDALRAGA